MLLAQSTPFMDVFELIDTLPVGIRIIADGIFPLPPNFRTCVAVEHIWLAFEPVLALMRASPLLATIAMFSALGLLLQGSVLLGEAL
jgi:hypothetical protein